MKFLDKDPLEEDLDGNAVQDEDDWPRLGGTKELESSEQVP